MHHVGAGVYAPLAIACTGSHDGGAQVHWIDRWCGRCPSVRQLVATAPLLDSVPFFVASSLSLPSPPILLLGTIACV
jgi:hypothetical protein